METPKNKEGALIEKLMYRIGSSFNPNAIIKNLDTDSYNKLYSAIYSELSNERKKLKGVLEECLNALNAADCCSANWWEKVHNAIELAEEVLREIEGGEVKL